MISPYLQMFMVDPVRQGSLSISRIVLERCGDLPTPVKGQASDSSVVKGEGIEEIVEEAQASLVFCLPYRVWKTSFR